jgi:hypothetical protein
MASAVSHWSNCVAGDFGALAGLASPCPGAAVLLCDQLCCCVCGWVRDRGRTGALGAVRELGRMAEVSWQTFRSRWRLRRQEFGVSRAVELCLSPEVFEARRLSSAMHPVRRRMVAQ